MTEEELRRWREESYQRWIDFFAGHQINYRTYRPSDHVDLQEQQLEEDLV